MKDRWALHARFYRMHLDLLPSMYITLDTSRLTALYFCVVGLDVLGMLDATVPATERAAMVEWIYGLQAADTDNGGFRGSSWAGAPLGSVAWPAHDADALPTFDAWPLAGRKVSIEDVEAMSDEYY